MSKSPKTKEELQVEVRDALRLLYIAVIFGGLAWYLHGCSVSLHKLADDMNAINATPRYEQGR